MTGVPPEQVPSRVDATGAAHDPIRPAFGDRTFASDPAASSKRHLDEFNGHAHSQYWDIGNGRPCTSLVNLGDITAGRRPTAR